MGKLYVVRHGETNFNVQGRYAGSTDVDLNEMGKNQARIMAASFKDKPIDIIITSSMKRALTTTNIIREYLVKPIVVLDEFVERKLGVYEGLTRDEVSKKFPKLWNENVLKQFDNTLHKGESVKQVRERVQKGLSYIKNNYRNQNVLLVTHGYISREIFGYFNKVSEDEFDKYILNNCQVAEYYLY